MAKPTYAAIAAHAGVGTATVERVLNGRGGVSHKTAEKVVLAARALDWTGRLPDRHQGIFRIEVILVRPDTSFFARLAKAFKRIAASLDPTIQIQVTFLNENNPAAIAAHVADPSLRRAGLVITAPDHPLVRDALRATHHKGLPIIQVVNRIIPQAEFIGVDNYAAGRTAGMLLARLGATQGTVVALCHSAVYRGHRDRIRGFSDYFAEQPHEGLEFRFVAFGQDDRSISARRIAEAFEIWPDLAGLYNVGGGNLGVLDALLKVGRHVFFVGHELNDHTRAALIAANADVILDQLPEEQARRAIDTILARLGIIDEVIENPPIRFAIITSENI